MKRPPLCLVMTSRVKHIFNVSEEEMRALVTAMGGDPATGVLNNLVRLRVSEDMWQNIGHVSRVVAYQGFDPRRMAAVVAGKLAMYENQDLVPLTLDGVTCQYTNEATTLDVPFLITLFLVRGNAVPKILATTDEAVKAAISRKCSGLAISTTREDARRMTSTTVTLARLSQAFPQVTATIIIGHGLEGKLQPKWLIGERLPLLMQHSIFSALIPCDTAYTAELQLIAKALNLEMTVMLQTPKEKRKMEGRDMAELEELSEKYVMAAVNGSVCTDAIKKRIMLRGEIIDALGELTLRCVVLHAACQRFLSMKERTYREAVAAMVRPVVVPQVAPQVEAAEVAGPAQQDPNEV